MSDYIISLGVALFLIILGIQFRRGKWLGILAGNVFSDKPIEEQKKNAKGCARLVFVVAFFLLSLNGKILTHALYSSFLAYRSSFMRSFLLLFILNIL